MLGLLWFALCGVQDGTQGLQRALPPSYTAVCGWCIGMNGPAQFGSVCYLGGSSTGCVLVGSVPGMAACAV